MMTSTIEDSSRDLGRDSSRDLANYEVLDNLSPVQTLQDSLHKQKDAEKQTFVSLVQDSVRLERELQKQDESYNHLQAQYKVKAIELEAEQNKSAALQEKVEDMGRDMALMIKAARKSKVKGQGHKPDHDGEGASAKEPQDEHTNRHKYDEKIRDLQLRLTRMAEDSDVKSKRLLEIERDLGDSKRYAVELEKHVTDDVREDIQNELQSKRPELGADAWNKQTNLVYQGDPRTYTYSHRANVKHSEVCTLL